LFAPRNISLIAALAVTGSLCACGGGGASNSAPAPQNAQSGAPQNPQSGTPQNLQSAQAPSLPIYVPATTLKATDSSGNVWTATYSSTASGTTTVNGQVAYGTSTSFTASMGATLVDSESTTQSALMNPYSPVGVVIYFASLPGRLSPGTVTGYDPLPSTLMAGQSGPLSSGTFGSSGYTFTETYSVTEDSPTALFLNIHLDYPDFGLFHGEASLTGLYSGTSTITYSINGSGAATLAKIQVTINGTTLTFQ
jgi:hypothetical protein